jgi:DNA-binding transcriptional LysR family regulator
MMIGRFLRKYPKVRFSVESIDISEFARKLLDERLDLGVGFLEGNRQSLQTLELFVENLVVIANKNLATKISGAMSLEDLARFPLVLFADWFLHEGANRYRSRTEWNSGRYCGGV